MDENKEQALLALQYALESRQRAERTETAYVALAKAAGASWNDIAVLYGTSRQAACQKWKDKIVER